MADVILRTKLFAPRLRPQCVERPVLVERLRAGESGKLSLFCAPAGFGKTSLVSLWLSETDRPVAWLSLDERDNDLVQFFAYVAAAIQNMNGVGRSSQAMIEISQPPPLTSLATALINDCTTADQHFLLVLDDYHVISEPEVHDAVTFLLDNLPPQLHLVITSRTDPLLPLSRLRAGGQVTEVRAGDLRFDRDETALFLHRMTGHELSTDQLAGLELRVEGWPAGLQMVALSIAGLEREAEISDLLDDFAASKRYIFDYLVDEVLDQRPPGLHKFLLQTSLLNRFSASLCDALTDRTGSGEVLEELERANLFIFPLDHDHRWFRYHHLFADLLRRRLVQAHPNDIDELHLRASRWFEDNGYPEDAIHHALEGHHDDRAARLSQIHGTKWLGQSNLHKARRWLEVLPEDQIRQRPHLEILYVWILLLTNQLDRAKVHLDNADALLEAARTNPEIVDNWGLDDPGTGLARIEGEIATCRAVVARANGEVDDMVDHLNRALSVLPDDAVGQRGSALLYLGFAEWMAGNSRSALASFKAALEAGHAAGRPFTVLSANTAMGRLTLELGALSEAEGYFREAFQFAEQHARRTGVKLPIVAEASTGLAKVAYERNDLTSARSHIEEALQKLEPLGVTEDWVDASMLKARLVLAEGNGVEADEILERVVSAVEKANVAPILRRQVKTHQLNTRLKGDSRAAADGARLVRSQVGVNTEPISYLMEEETLVDARRLLVSGDFEAALRLLHRLDEVTRAAGRHDRLIRVMLLEAEVLTVHGEDDQAMAVLSETLTLAESAGYLRTLLDESAWLADLLAELPRTGYRDRLLAEMAAFIGDPPVIPMPPHPATTPDVALSDRELEVLRLLATHLSGPEIARELYVSANTLKTHTRSIYRKLGVNRRSDAVAKAHSISLI